MEQKSIFADREIAFLKELEKRKIPFMIVGAAAAALQGAPVVTQDIDLWFQDFNDPKIREAVKAVGGAWVPSVGLNPPMLAGEGLKLFDIVLSMHGLDEFSKEVRHSFIMAVGPTRVRVLKLERIIKSKEAVKRPKDLLILPSLRNALTAIKNKRKRIQARKN
ncbi:MAG: hypothetical protein A2Y86_03065 [Candidatus Aminicenantes bacterium RBG_13_62_12]|nr:MAG: hypothetical protein A2Y86_03065 [Candidatus Aminicenantes bacterium RBG_13_62_12]